MRQKGIYNESPDSTRFFEIVRNIIYWLGSCGVWCYADANINARADKYTLANQYTTADNDSNINEYIYANEYCDTNRDCDSDGNRDA